MRKRPPIPPPPPLSYSPLCNNFQALFTAKVGSAKLRGGRKERREREKGESAKPRLSACIDLWLLWPMPLGREKCGGERGKFDQKRHPRNGKGQCSRNLWTPTPCVWYVIRPSFLLAASLEEEEAARPAPASEARPGLSLPLCQKKATLEIGKFSLSLWQLRALKLRRLLLFLSVVTGPDRRRLKGKCLSIKEGMSKQQRQEEGARCAKIRNFHNSAWQ